MGCGSSVHKEAAISERAEGSESDCLEKMVLDDSSSSSVDVEGHVLDLSDGKYSVETSLNEETIALDLSRNSFDVVPELSALHSLTSLTIAGNNLGSIPEAVFHISTLKFIDVRENKLETLSNAIGLCCKLRGLELSHNRIASVPPEIGNLSRLKVLNCEFNEIRKLPTEMDRLVCLTELSLGSNKLVTIPLLTSLVKLRILSLGNNTIKVLKRLP